MPPSGRGVRSHLAAKTSYSPARTPVANAAAIYSLIGSAKLNGLDRQAYLRLAIERIADHPMNRVEKLLPWNVAAELSGAPVELAA
jgi:hypothetical protein